MEGADRDRSARVAPAAAGTLDAAAQAPGKPAAAQAPGKPATGTDPGRPPGWWRRWLNWMAARPGARQAALLLGFIVAGAAVTWRLGRMPLAGYLVAGRLPSTRDTASYVWGFWWMAHQVTHLANPWFTGLMAAPAGVQLGFHTVMPLPGLLLTPVTLIFGPSASYNLVVLITPGLLSYAMYRAARLWLPSATGAIAAGAFFGLSAMLAEQAWYHLNIAIGAVFLPMALEASVRLRRTPGRRQAIILGLVMSAAVLTDQESAVLAAIVTGLTLLPWLVYRPSWAKLRPAALAVAIGAVIASPQIIAMIQEVALAHARGGLAIDPHLLAVSYKQYGIGLPGMFTPTPRVADFGLARLAGPFLHGRDNEGMPMFGTVLTVLALFGLAVSWRRRSAWLLAALWAGCAALALGTSLWIGRHQYLPLALTWQGVRVSGLMPYTWFVRLPGLSSFREADRLAILGLLPAALLAGAAVNWLRYHSRPLLVVVLALAVLETGYSGSSKVGTMRTSYPGVDRGIAADASHSIVVDLPFGMRGGIPVYGAPFFPKALVMATADGHPRAIAYTSRVPQYSVRAIEAHPFYRELVYIQHQVSPSCPWAVPSQAAHTQHPWLMNGCADPAGVTPLYSLKLSPAQLAAARQDARRLNIGWIVVWKRNNSVQDFILPFIRATGFKYAYRDHNVLVYRRA
jgi:hypothetical protein